MRQALSILYLVVCDLILAFLLAPILLAMGIVLIGFLHYLFS